MTKKQRKSYNRKIKNKQEKQRKARKKINKTINELNKKGYEITKDVLPTIPKNINSKKYINKLNSLTKVNLEKIATKNGKTFYENKNNSTKSIINKINLASKSKHYDYIPIESIHISSFKNELYDLGNINSVTQRTANILLNWLDNLIKKTSIESVSNMLEIGREKGCIITFEVLYKTDVAQTYMTEMLNYLNDDEMGVITREEIQDNIEDLEMYDEVFPYES